MVDIGENLKWNKNTAEILMGDIIDFETKIAQVINKHSYYYS